MKKRFYPKSIMFYVSEDMKEKLSNIPNASEYIRIAIEEKLRRDEKVENAGEVSG